MIEVRNLTKAYGGRVAVDSISFDVAKGEILGFLGPNGAGKTTTMRVLTGFLPATSGSATIAGYDIFEQSLETRRRIGYLPENVPLYLDLPVEHYLTYMGTLKGVAKADLPGRLEKVLASCGLTHRRHDIIGHLSRGYRQRVGLAQALVHNPDVLILDEPTASLDPVQIREVRETIRNLAGEHTIILSTHILPEVELVCDRVLMINRGHIIADNTPRGLRTQAAGGADTLKLTARGSSDDLVRVVLAVPGVTSTERIEGGGDGLVALSVKSDGDVAERVASAVVGAGFGLRELAVQGRSLEDIFVELATEEVAPAQPTEEVA